MTIPLFTLTGNIASLIGASQIPSTNLSLVLRSNIRAGDLLAISGAAKFIDPVYVMLDSSGNINGGNGVKLLADDPVLGLETPVQWSISSTGQPEISGWTFNAPTAGTVMNILDALPVPGMTAVGITKGPKGDQGVPGVQGPPGVIDWIDGGFAASVFGGLPITDGGSSSTSYGGTASTDGGTA